MNMTDPRTSGLSKERLFDLYRTMLRIRRFEERVEHLYAHGKLPGFVHLYIGEEAVATGVCAVLRQDDFITSTHRGHGHTIAKGGDVAKMMAELYGKVTGYCRGKGGSMHITDMSIGMLGANGIVAGGPPIAVGSAYGAAKIRRTDQVAVAFFGDGATNEGPFAEACNMASAWRLPVVFVCENNRYGVGTRIGRVAPTEDVAVRASGFLIPAVTVDGNDVLAVRAAAAEAVARARAGQGPTFIECKTWRHRGHFQGEDPSYMHGEEHDQWLAKDPIRRLANALTEAGLATREELEAIDQDVRAAIDRAVEFAEASPLPQPETALEDVYA
ncbi:MAG: thiamine pyrophosphate-dependent dehydrogenase E1 component subunit alpha [Anaerolineae bacterium]